MIHRVEYNYLKYSCQFGSYLITKHERNVNYFFFIYHQTLNTSLRKPHLGKFLWVKFVNTFQILLYKVTHPCWVIYHCVVIIWGGPGFYLQIIQRGAMRHNFNIQVGSINKRCVPVVWTGDCSLWSDVWRIRRESSREGIFHFRNAEAQNTSACSTFIHEILSPVYASFVNVRSVYCWLSVSGVQWVGLQFF